MLQSLRLTLPFWYNFGMPAPLKAYVDQIGPLKTVPREIAAEAEHMHREVVQLQQ